VGPVAADGIFMTENRAAKKAARARMAATGEPYSVARRSAHGDLVADGLHFVALVSGRLGPGGHGASIRDARTGAVTDLVKPPPDVSQFTAVTSAGGGLFFLSGQSLPGSGLRIGGKLAGPGPARMYRLQVDDTGRAAELAQLPSGLLPPGCRHITACPGGNVLAYISAGPGMPPGRLGTEEAGLVDLVSGKRRPAHLPAGRLSDLSWASDQRTLALTWHPESGGQPGIFVTDTSTAGDWVSAGRLVDATQGLPDDLIDPVISADGGEIYCTTAQPDPRGGPHWNRLLAIPVHGGQPRTLFELRYRANSYNLHYMWTKACRDATGRYLLAFTTGYVYRVEIPAAAFTRLPFPEGQPYAAAW
jgi:hypothetical protein